jgi:hypothetical protein
VKIQITIAGQDAGEFDIDLTAYDSELTDDFIYNSTFKKEVDEKLYKIYIKDCVKAWLKDNLKWQRKDEEKENQEHQKSS